IDRRSGVGYVKRIALLEARLGNKEQALKIGRELVTGPDRGPDAFRTFAELCMELGDAAKAIDALRRGARLHPVDLTVHRALADALSAQGSAEAAEVYFELLRKTQRLDEKLELVAKLADLYQRLGR